MMSVKYFSLLAALVVVCLAHDDDHENHCHLDGFPEVHMNKGDIMKHPQICAQIHCIDPLTEKIDMKTCPAFAVRDGCKVDKGDNTKPFPECCSQPKCS